MRGRCSSRSGSPTPLGEWFRAKFFEKTYGLCRGPVLTSIVVERLFDGLIMVGGLAIGLRFFAGTGRPAATLRASSEPVPGERQ
jgi:hypothetical protein